MIEVSYASKALTQLGVLIEEIEQERDNVLNTLQKKEKTISDNVIHNLGNSLMELDSVQHLKGGEVTAILNELVSKMRGIYDN